MQWTMDRRTLTASQRFFLFVSWAVIALRGSTGLVAQDELTRPDPPDGQAAAPAPSTAEPAEGPTAASDQTTRAPSEYRGWTDLAADDDLSGRYAEAVLLLQERDWTASLAILTDLLDQKTGSGVEAEANGVGVRRRWVSEDARLFWSVPGAIADAVAALGADGDAVRRRLVESGHELPAFAIATEELPKTASDETALGTTQWRCVMGRYDHAALELSEDRDALLGGYCAWLHRFEHQRELKSSDARKNPFYTYYQPQIVTAEDLVIFRSHQDVVAVERDSGAVRWHVVSEQPDEQQTHNRASGFSSWRYFTDIGGWSLSVVGGRRGDQVVVVDLSGRPTRSGGTFRYRYQSQLRSYDARTGEPLWTAGGEGARHESLRGLTFAAPPTPVVSGGDTVLVAPLVSADGYFLAGLTTEGTLLWLEAVYRFDTSRKEVEDGIYEAGLAHGAALAARSGICVAAPGHGVVAAVNASGEMLWASRYRSSIRGHRADPTWAPGHPVISGDVVVVAPFDSDYLSAFNLQSGRSLWESRAAGGYSLFLGADEERCYTLNAKGHVRAVSLADGASLWTSEPVGKPAGRGVVTSRGVYVAVQGAVVVLDGTTGRRVATSEIWDSGVPAPVPGNLFLSGSALYLAAPWGVARIEAYDATLARVGDFPLAEQPAVRGRILRRLGRYADALEDLRRALRQSSSEKSRSSLQAELLELAREAAASSGDVGVIQRTLESRDVRLTDAERTSFLLRVAADLETDAPESVAATYRRVVEHARPGALVVSPDGLLVQPGLYASDRLRELVEQGRITPDPREERRVARWIRGATVRNAAPAFLAEILLFRSHVLAAAGSHARLMRWASERGDDLEADQYLLRLEADYPRLSHLDPVRRAFEGWRRGERPRQAPRNPAETLAWLGEELPWAPRFDQEGRSGDLVTTASGSAPLPGVLVFDDGMLRFFNHQGEVVSEMALDGFTGLEEPRSKLSSRLLEPCVAHFDEVRDVVLLSTPVGLFEVLGLTSAEPRLRRWFRETHPLIRRWDDSGGGVDARRSVVRHSGRDVSIVTAVQRFGTIPSDRPFYTGVHFIPEGHPVLVQPGGEVVAFEAGTGRIRHHAGSDLDAVASSAPGPGRTLVVAGAEPAQLVVHTLDGGEPLVLPASAPPWRWAVIPGLAVVIDTPAGIEVRQLTPGREGAPDGRAPHYALWRDVEPRGQPALVYADARQVLVVEAGGRLVSRELRSGRSRWSLSFPADIVPVASHLVGDRSSGDLVVFGSRTRDHWAGAGVLPQESAEDLVVMRLSLDGEERWTSQLATGKVACDGRWIARALEWWLAYNVQDGDVWKTRVLRLDPGSGEERVLIDHALPSAPLYPAPRVSVTTEGIAVGNLGSWAWYAPGKPAIEKKE